MTTFAADDAPDAGDDADAGALVARDEVARDEVAQDEVAQDEVALDGVGGDLVTGAQWHDGRHPDAAIEEWVFAAWTPDASLGVISGHRLVGPTAWYWAALARAGRPLLHITDFDVPVRVADPFIVKGESMWAEHTRESPMEQWTVGNETYASALDDPNAAFGRAYGHPTPISFDLEWYAVGAPHGLEGPAGLAEPRGTAGPSRTNADGSTGYTQPGVVHGSIEILDEPTVELAEVPARRWHRWTVGTGTAARLGPLLLPEAVAHTGVRAPFAFPDGSSSDLVLTRSGWRRRVSRRTL